MYVCVYVGLYVRMNECMHEYMYGVWVTQVYIICVYCEVNVHEISVRVYYES